MRDISIEEFMELDPETIQLVDVREPLEYNTFHIKGAINIPKGIIVKKSLELDKKRPLYLICKSGLRSAFMGNVMENLGFESINVCAGNDAYLKLNLKVGK